MRCVVGGATRWGALGMDCRLVHQGHRHSRQRTRTRHLLARCGHCGSRKIQRRWGSSTRLKCCAPWPPALRCPFLSASTTPSGSRPPSWCSGRFRESPVNRRGRGLFPRSSSHIRTYSSAPRVEPLWTDQRADDILQLDRSRSFQGTSVSRPRLPSSDPPRPLQVCL